MAEELDEGRTTVSLPAGTELLDRTYEGECAWVDGTFHNRHAVDRAVSLPADGALRTRRVIEDCPSLDGTAATVGTFERVYGNVLRVPSAAVNVHVEAEIAAVSGVDSAAASASPAQRVWLMVDDVPVASVELPVAGADAGAGSGLDSVRVSADVALTRRGCDIAFVADVQPAPAGAPAPECVVRGEGECAVRLLSLAVTPADMPCPAASSTVFVASDSLAQTYPESVRPQTGWAEFLAHYLGVSGCVIAHDDAFAYEAATRYEGTAGPVVVNAAMAARSARSFIAEGKLAQLLACVRPGDVLVFQFGANDATVARPLRYSSLEEFEAFLDRYVACARDRGATPVVVTPPPRHNFDVATGELTIDFATYADVEHAYCAREGVALVDLSAEGGVVVASMGAERSRALYMKLSAGQYANHPDGIDDSTHLSALGARTFGRIVARGLAAAVDGLEFCADADCGMPSAPAGLAARITDAKGAGSVALVWDADSAAEYYTVSRESASAGEDSSSASLSLATALEPRFVDIATPGRPESVVYEVTAWRGNEHGPASRIVVSHAFRGLADTGHRIGGMDLYEVDTAGIADRIAFSVRFNACSGVTTYKVMAHNTVTDQFTVLGTIVPEHVDDLHSYGVSRESGWEIYVEGTGTDGVYRSDAKALPNELPAGGGRSSWEVPF